MGKALPGISMAMAPSNTDRVSNGKVRRGSMGKRAWARTTGNRAPWYSIIPHEPGFMELEYMEYKFLNMEYIISLIGEYKE